MKKILHYHIPPIKALKTMVVTFILITMPVLTTFADDPGEPCDQNDPIGNCPLDTWVIILFLIALVFTVFHLHKKQKSLQA